MKWIKKVAETPLEAIAKVIDSFSSGSDKTTNAPSIRVVEDALSSKASNDDLEAATMDLNAAIAEKADINAMFIVNTYNYSYELEAGSYAQVQASDLSITAISGYTPIAFKKIDCGSRYINTSILNARTNATIVGMRNMHNATVSGTLSVTLVFARDELIEG